MTDSLASRLRETAELYGFDPQSFLDYLMRVLAASETRFSPSEEKLPLETKVGISRDVISAAFASFQKPIFLTTGSCESVMELYLVKEVAHNIKRDCPLVLFIEHQMQFKETVQFVKSLTAEWKLELIFTNNKALNDREYGAALDVNSLGEDMKAYIAGSGLGKKELALKEKIATKLLLYFPFEKFMEAGGFDCGFLPNDITHGIRSSSFFQSFKTGMRINPLLLMDSKDIWEFTINNELPTHPLYSKGYECIDNKYGCRSVGGKPIWERYRKSSEEDEYSEVIDRLKRIGYS